MPLQSQKSAAAHIIHVQFAALLNASRRFKPKIKEVPSMLEITREVLEKVDLLLDVGETQSAAELLLVLDPTSLRALIIHVLRERGAAVADAIADAYMSATANRTQQPKAA